MNYLLFLRPLQLDTYVIYRLQFREGFEELSLELVKSIFLINGSLMLIIISKKFTKIKAGL